ncbi:chitin binding peritrophin, partial [Brachionus plicatilis]
MGFICRFYLKNLHKKFLYYSAEKILLSVHCLDAWYEWLNNYVFNRKKANFENFNFNFLASFPFSLTLTEGKFFKLLIRQCEILVQKLLRIPGSAKTLQFNAEFNQGFFDGVHFIENCRVFAELGILLYKLKGKKYSFGKYKLTVLFLLPLAINGELTDNELKNSSAASRCPSLATEPGIYLFGDTKLCNVYHECECTAANSSQCSLVRTNVCPIGSIYLNATNKCEPIELHGCDSSYLQSVNTAKNQTLQMDEESERPERQAEPVNVTGITQFKCPSGANDRFADAHICNLFHVCVSRGQHTFDQPFLCPFSSIFRVIDSTTMYCDQRRKNDCVHKAFYQSTHPHSLLDNSLLLLATTDNSTQCHRQILEDHRYCNLFHICRHNKRLTYMCDNQLLFNPLSQICDYPINVVCYNKKIYTKSDQYTHSSAPSTANVKSNSMLKKNGSLVQIYEVKVRLSCGDGERRNYVRPDPTFCNVYHQCYGDTGNAFVCGQDQAYEPKVGACAPEHLVECAHKLMVTESGQRAARVVHHKMENYVSGSGREELVVGIAFDCRGRPNGHWRDGQFCDVFHACINNEQKKTYTCAQLGEKTYFDEETRRCEFAKHKPLACPTNRYFKSTASGKTSSVVSKESGEGWRGFIRSREAFSCAKRLDGFYASRWCNVFYRCFLGVKTEFLCPKMLNSDRLWWVQHGSSQETPQTSAACVWPCETKRKCTSAGGSIVEVEAGKYEESGREADRVWRNSNCDSGDSGLDDVFRLSDAHDDCSGQPEGAFFASQYCNVFHRCTNGKRKDFQCPKATNTPYDLWWNDDKAQCDWPCKVQCDKQIYASVNTATQIQAQDRALNQKECRTITNSFKPKNNLNRHFGRVASAKYCNVFYECGGPGDTPSGSFYCVDGLFETGSKECASNGHVQCAPTAQLIYPFVAIREQSPVEDIACSNSIGSYTIHSKRFCNIFYECDGRSTKPITHRCFDRERMRDALFNRQLRRCEANTASGVCHGELLPMKVRYQSSPIEHGKYADLVALSCRADQQYLAEHHQYCNLYHSCILGKYQMYACVTLGSFDQTSYFYYTNGDCAAPSAAHCPSNKAIYPYEKLFDNNINRSQSKFMPVVSPSLTYKGQSSY